jgi:hypothetical protein
MTEEITVFVILGVCYCIAYGMMIASALYWKKYYKDFKDKNKH